MENFDINTLLNASFDEAQKKVDLHVLFEKRLEEYGMTVNQATEILDIERKSLLSILSGEARQPNLINVLKLAQFLDISLNSMLTSILARQHPANIAQLQTANRASFIAKNFDVDKLARERFIKSKVNSDHIINRIITFFGFENLYDFENFEHRVNTILFSQTNRTFSDKMRSFAIKSAYRLFELIDNPNEYNREAVKELIPKIKPYCRDVENGLYIVCRALYNHGVTVTFQNHLTTSQYRGATFVVHDKPCIVLTDLHNLYPSIWFALLHELYHVLFNYEDIKKTVYHLSGQPEIFLVNENLADEFAGDFFFTEEMYQYIKPMIHNEYLVDSLAKTNNIHRSFVYRGFQHYVNKIDGKDYWKAFHKYFPDLRPAVSKLNPLSWSDDSNLTDLSITLKSIFELNNGIAK